MATNGGNIVVPVGVQLELNNVQEVISILQKALSNIKPDTSAFKGISKIITEMTREMERLQVQSSKGFSSQKQFDQAGQTVDKLEESLIRAQLAMQNLKFSDLKLNPMQENVFKGFEKELELIEQKLNNVKEKVKQDIFNNDISKSQLSIIDPKGLSKSFDEIDKLINQRAQTVKGEIDGYKAQLSLLNEAVNKGNTAQKLLTEGITGDIFGGKYTYTNANGILGFKPGTAKSEFLKALKDEFSLTDADLDQLKNLTFGKMSELFKSMGQGNQKNIFEQWIKNLVGDTSQSNVLNEKVKKLEEVQNAVLALQQKIQDAKADGTPLSIALEQNQGDIARVAAAIQQYQNSALGAVNSNQKLNDSFNSMKSQLTTFTSQLNAASTEFLKLQSQQQTFNSIKMAITNFMGFTQVLNLTKNAVKEAMNHIKQLDTTMNAIAIVSEMTTEDLWKQVDAYSEVAQKYGTTIQGAYEVSKIYYQAGYETSEVMTLMNETLKLSKVSGLDYAKTTDYMMTATRGFHMEISEAASVVDVYSALAANTAVSQKELAEAMSKTASSMEGVGASFQEASAMIATMVAVTRESSQNIGSSLKSIASRYGELTKDPAKLIDSEGVEMSFNKVDEALQSVGISLQTADHQFRDFTEVILELTDVWDKLDSTQQRYIATQFAGNRQQSRFLALVSNGDLLRENIEVAEDSEDTGTLQTLKSLDSIESKLNQVQVAYQQFYTSIGAESAWKTALDGIRNFIDSLNNLPKAFEKIPLGAATVVIDAISIIRTIGLQGLSLIVKEFTNNLKLNFQETQEITNTEGKKAGEKFVEGLKQGLTSRSSFQDLNTEIERKAQEAKDLFNASFSIKSFNQQKLDNSLFGIPITADSIEVTIEKLRQLGRISDEVANEMLQMDPSLLAEKLRQMGEEAEQAALKLQSIQKQKLGSNLEGIGSALNIISNALNKSSRSGQIFAGSLMGVAGALRAVGSVMKWMNTEGAAFPWLSVAMAAITIINGIATAIETPEEKLERLNKEAEQLTNTAKQIKSDEKTLQKSIDKVEELKLKRYESAEAAEEYQQAVEDLADKFPELIMGFDEAGNVIVDLQSAEETLAAARQKTLQATYDAAVAEQKAQQQQIDNAKGRIKNFNDSYLGSGYEGLDFLRENDKSSIKENISKILMSKDYNNLISKNLLSGQMNVKDLFEPENLKQLALMIQTNFLGGLDAEAAEVAQSVKTLTDIENIVKNSVYSQNEELQQLLENLKQAQESPEEAANNSVADTMAAFIAQLDNIDFNTEEGQKQYEDFIKAYNTLDEGVKDYFNQNIFNVEDLINEIETIVTSDSQIKGINKSLIDSYLKLTKVNEEGWEFLEENNNAALLLTNELTKIWSQENNKDLSWDNFKNSEDFKNGIEEFYNAYNQLGEDKQKILKELEIDTRSYTANDVKEMLGTLEEEDNPINSYVDNLFKSAEESKKKFKEIFDNLEATKDSNLFDSLSVSLINLESGLKEINESLVFSPEALTFIDSQAKQISKLNNDGFIKAAQKMADQTVELMRVLYEDSMSPQERSTALSIINNANLQTKEGFDEAIDQIKKSTIDSADQDALIEQLTKQKQEIIDNVILSLNADLASITEQTENDSKLLSKVTSGLTIKETNELIQSAKGWGLDLTLQDFIPDGDKLIASEEAFIQIQQKYKDKIEKAKEKAEEDLSKAKEIGLYDGESFIDIPNQLTEEQLEFINKQIKGFSEDSENFEGKNLSKVGKEKIQEMYKGIENALFNYGSSVANLFNTVFSEQNWNKGDYSSLMNDPRFALKNPLNNLFIEFDDIFNSEEFNKYLTGEQKYTINEPQIKKAVEKARSGVDKFLSDLLNKGIDKFNPADYANEGIEKSTYNQMVEDLKNFGNNYVDFIKKYADLTGKTESEIDSLIAQAYNKQNENNAYNALKDIVGSFDQISFEAGQKIVRSIEGFELEDFDTDPITGSLQLSYEKALELLNEGIKDKTSKEYNELRAQIEKRQTDLSTSKILSNIIQNRSKLSEENIAAMANIFKTSYETIERSLIKNNDGTYTIGLDKIQEMIDKAQLVLGHSVSELFSNEIDAIIKSITGITSDQSKGFTDLSSMQKYVKGLRDKGVKLNGKNLNFDQLFEYNESLRAYQLTTQGVIAQIAAGKQEIDNLKKRLEHSTSDTEQKDLLEQIAIGETFIQDTIKGFADAIDFESLINATNGYEDSEARKNITQAIEDYNAAKAALVGDGAKFVAINAQALIQAIGGGGANAVAAAQKIAEIRGKTLSDDTVEKLYRKQVNNFVEAIDKVGAQAGEIVDSTTGALIGMSGGKVSILEDTGLAVVESAANLYEAYNNLLQRMAATGEATLAELNNVAAKALENRDGEQQAIDALGDASSMTYTRFGEILAQQGIELTEQLINSMTNAGMIKQLGGAKMAITDFQGFADLMGWEAGSEEYISAFKTYNDSMIQMNRQVERNILEEAQSVADAQGGDWINLTQLTSKMQETYEKAMQSPTAQTSGMINPLTALNEKLKDYGAYIEDGILKIDENADIPSIMQAVAQAAAESGGLLSNEMAQLADTVADAIKSYADLISGGIEGSLNNEQAERLQDWANKNGVGELNFTQTADGLKVATNQAFKLVEALKNVDSMQGKLTFDNLVEALSNDKGGKFENISKTTAEIAKAQRQIAKNNQEIKDIRKFSEGDIEADNRKVKRLQEQNQELREQIGLYREIQQAQSVDPSQYDFMNRDIPEVMQGPINYWNSVGEAFAAMNEAHKTGKMEIQDFYNIVNEMNNLVAATNEAVTLGYDAKGNAIQLDGSLESAAAIIEKGMGALTNVDGKGVKVNLEKLGIDFVSGADSAKSNFAEGVHALAESQIAMLDAAIKVLEVVVAMGQLKDVDVNGDNKLNIGEIFDLSTPETGDFTDNFKKGAQAILDMADEVGNEDLKEALNDISVNGNTLREMLEVAAKGMSETGKSWEDLGLTEQQYASIIDSFYQALMNGDYDLDTIQNSVWEILDKTLPDGTVIEVGDRAITIAGGTHTVINWNDENTKEALKYFGEDVENSKKEVQAAIQRYQTGQGNTIDAIITLAVNGEIQIEVDENNNIDIIGPNGQKIDPKSDAGRKIISEAALKNAGIKDGEVITDPMGYFIRSEGTIKVGNTTFKVTSDGDGNVKYHSDRMGYDFSSVDDLLQAEYQAYLNSLDPKDLQYAMSFEAWAHQTYGIHVDTTTKFTGKDGSEITDPGNDPQLQDSVRKFLSQSQESIQKQLNSLETDGAGHYTLKLPGGNAITVDASGPEEAAAKIEAEIKALYAPIADSVSAGITQAFTATENGATNAVQDAITKAIKAAYSGGADGVPIENVTIKPTNLTMNLDGVSDPTIGGATETKDIDISEVTLKPTKVSLNLDEYTPSSDDASGSTDEVPISTVTLKPDKVELNLEGYTPSTEDTDVSNEEVPISSVTLKPNKVELNLEGYTPSEEEVSKEVPSNEVTVTPKKITIDTGKVKPEELDTLEGTAKEVNVTPSAAPTVKTEGLVSSIDSLDSTLATLNVTGVTNPVDLKKAINSSAGESGLSIDSMDATLTTLNINSVGSATVNSAAAEGAAEGATVPTVDSLDGKVTTLKITEVGSGEYAAGDEAAAPTIPSLNATVTSLKVDATEVDVTSAAEAIAKALQEALDGNPVTPTVNAPESGGDGGSGEADSSGLSGLSEAISTLNSNASKAAGQVSAIATSTSEITSAETVAATNAINGVESGETVTAAGAINGIVSTAAENAKTAINTIDSGEASYAKLAINGIDSGEASNAKTAINGISSTEASNAKTAINGISSAGASNAKTAINGIDSGPAREAKSALNSISVKLEDKSTDVTLKYHVRKASATGNIGNFAKVKGTGPAKVGGSTKTLMGELGPELVVSNGRYFIAGANGAEFVDLADDAIVFNHLQTRRLMSQGAIGGRGRPTTNEREAVAFAKGKVPNYGPAKAMPQDPNNPTSETISSVEAIPSSVTLNNVVKFRSKAKGTGPAMSSASAALAALKQLRAMWESLLRASLADMGGMPGGSGGGGGGGGGDNKETAEDVQGILENVERWYNWLALIEEKQNKINILTKEYDLLTAKGASNKKLAVKLEEQAKNLQIQLDTAKQLAEEQKKYREEYINRANNGLFGAFYHADPNTGRISLSNDEAFMKYVKKTAKENGNQKLLENLLNGKNINATYTDEEKELIGKQALQNRKNISKEEYKNLSDDEKKYYNKSGKLKSAKKIGEMLTKSSNTRVKILREGGIKSGLDFMNELFGQLDDAGNNKHTAKEQLALIKAMGFYTDDLLTGVDTSQDNWEEQVVQNFKDKVESDKTEIEALNKSIQEQQEAALEYEKAIQEINNQYKEMVKPIEAVTDHLEEWYEWTRKIATEQSKLNLLTKEYNTLTLRKGDTTSKQLENLKQQAEKTKQMRDNTQESLNEMQNKQKTYQENMEVKRLSKKDAKDLNRENDKENKRNASLNQRRTKLILKQQEKNNEHNEQAKADKEIAAAEIATKRQAENIDWNKKRTQKWDNISNKNKAAFTTKGKLKKELRSDDELKAYKKLSPKQKKFYEEIKENDEVVGYKLKGKREDDLEKLKKQVTDEDIANLNKENKKWNKARNNVGQKRGKILTSLEGLSDEEKKYYKKTRENGKTVYKLKGKKKDDYVVGQLSTDPYDIQKQLADEWNAEKNKKYSKTEINDDNKSAFTNRRKLKARLSSDDEIKAYNNLTPTQKKFYEPIKKKGQIVGYKLKDNKTAKDFNNELETNLKTDWTEGDATAFAAQNGRNIWYDFDEDGNLIYNKKGFSDFVKNSKAKKNKGFKVTQYSNKMDNGYYVRKYDGDEYTKQQRDEALKSTGLTKADSLIDLQDEISNEDYKKLSSKQKKLYGKNKKTGKWVLGGEGNTVGLDQEQIHAAQKKVRGYDKGTNVFQPETITGDKNGTQLQRDLDELYGYMNDPEKFYQKLTGTDANGNASFDGRQQMEILEQLGLGDAMADVAQLESWNTATEEEKIEAAKKYLEKIKETPEEYNKLLDQINENKEKLEEYKNQVMEINNQIRELLKPIDGVTEHLESWYEWTRKIASAQNELNRLTAEYSNLEKSPGDNTSAKAKNLTSQAAQVKKQIDANEEERTERKTELDKEKDKVKKGPFSKLFSLDDDENVVYSTIGLEGINGKTTIEVQDLDEKGNERKDINGTAMTYEEFKTLKDYDNKTDAEKEALDTEWDIGIVSSKPEEVDLDKIFSAVKGDGITPEEFINTLTATDANEKAILSLQQQRAALEKAGFKDEMAELYGQGSWDELDAQQRNEAAKAFLEDLSKYPEKVNQLSDEFAAAVTTGENLKGEILDINQQLKELATIAAGIQNPFEQWHSWLQKIKQEQNQLNISTKQYSNLEKERVNNGSQIADNLKEQLKNLQGEDGKGGQIKTNEEYLAARQTDYNKLINTDNWTDAQKKFFKVDENNQLQYNDANFIKQIQNRNGIELIGGTDENGIYNYRNIEETIDFSATGIEDFLDKLTKQKADNSMEYNTDQQFEILKAFGFSDLMQYDSSGNPIFQYGIKNATDKEREAAVKTVLDNLKGFQDKIESSADNLQELREKGIELTGNVIDIKNQIQDNEIELENKILQAIEDREQKRIDDLKEQKDMLSEAADNFLNGLSEQLDKEKKMYEKQESQDELTKLQRQLAILQRSGGSSSQIRSLQEQIKSQQKDMYFEERQDQIDAIKEASDKQIEKLDKQIQIAEETLAFNKENGLYWKEVRDIMKLDSDEILSFIETNLAERKSQSTLQADLAVTDDGKIVGTYTGTKGMVFKTGGLADYTGPAWLDGTKKKPESILNADQTDFLRNKLIDNLESFSLAINQFAKGALSNNLLNDLSENSGINIEQLDFVMKVDSIANDYDAKRAGQQAFDEMVRIARKTGNRSISRR